MIAIVGLVDIYRINAELTGNRFEATRLGKLASVYSSYLYYSSEEEQISSVVLSIIKNHHFYDGNKRTALAVLLILAAFNNIPIDKTNSELVAIFVGAASSSFSVAAFRDVVFK